MAGTTHIGEALAPRDTGARRQGRYVLGDLLGRGGMAEVFAGQSMGSHGFQKPVAIKRLLPELANDHMFVERLISEAKLLVGMQHGNIVSVLDLARDGDDVFLVMEYVDGPTLRQLLKARGASGLPFGIATYVIQTAAAGLEFAHGRGVVHADISPSNLLLTSSGEVRVADFGIARREGGGVGFVEGKAAYMAPEQARGEALTPRSDVFALGVVLYELITGEHPLGRQITANERGSEPLRVIPPRVVRPTIPFGLDAICMRALAPDARDRYGRMQDLIDALADERFANSWREGANDLAQAIRAIATPAVVLHHDRQLTIVTRSLIQQRMPSPTVLDPAPSWPVGTATVGIAPLATRVDGTPPEVQRIEALPPSERNTVVGPVAIAAPRSYRWALAILGVATLAGVLAALAIQRGSDDPTLEPRSQPVAAPPAAPTPVASVAPPAAPTSAPDAAPEPAAPIARPPAPVTPPPPRKARVARAAELSPARKADATLIVRAEDRWAFVYVGNQRKDMPPSATFKLPAGTYRVVAKNTDDGGSVTVCNVTITAGKAKIVAVSMEQQRCYE